MGINKRLLVAAAMLTTCILAVWCSTSISSSTYELRPQITLPEYKTDTRHSIEAYERMMNRLMDLNEKSFDAVRSETRGIDKKLDLIDLKLTNLCERIARIEKILTPEPATDPIQEKAPPQSLDIDKSANYEFPALRKQ